MKVPVEGTEPIHMEVEVDPAGVDRVSRAGDVIATAAESLQEAVGRIRPVAEAFLSGVRDMTRMPEELTVEFGVKLTAEAGVVIAKAASEGHFTVSMKWNHATS
ncbi:CU044_2847 family protein [Streptomyces roseifaciens]|uniref:CU044_2847 family protein n=1 Tax=Streptomyces roseifaciens TaxID=1488406 RepID=UPI0011875B70|nr:CU044_2847 family protein [Streptomyces roseifaciens]